MSLGKCPLLIRKFGHRHRWIILAILVATPFVLVSIGIIGRNDHISSDRQPGTPTVAPLIYPRTIGKEKYLQASNPIGDRFEKRRKDINAGCESLKEYYVSQSSEAAVKEHLVIDRNLKLTYCAIEKIGCTFWKRVFQILSGFRNVTDPFAIKGLYAYEGYKTARNLPFDTIHKYLQDSTKFMFVREPYERLLSGYVDKLYAPNAAYWKFIGRHIINQFRPNASNISIQCGHDITFEEFAKYFIYSQFTNKHRDAHFVPSFEHCRPCEISYDYIGKLETFKEDTFYLLKKMKLDHVVQFDNFQNETDIDAILDAADYVYSMKPGIVACMPLPHALFRAFRKLQIRGIISKNVPFPIPLDTTRDISLVEFKALLLKAHSISGDHNTRKKNRQEAFLEAYRTLSPALMERLKRVMMVDAVLFGYETMPKILLSKPTESESKSDFRYFSFS